MRHALAQNAFGYTSVFTTAGFLFALGFGLFGITLQASAENDQVFYLEHDASGKTFGPYTNQVGSEVVIDDTAFTVRASGNEGGDRSSAPTGGGADSPRGILQNTRIPKVAFQNTPLPDAISELRQKIGNHKTSQRAISIIYKRPPVTAQGGAGRVGTGKKVTLIEENATAMEILQKLMEQADYSMSVRERTVVLSPSNN